jgi:hypothetical protein
MLEFLLVLLVLSICYIIAMFRRLDRDVGTLFTEIKALRKELTKVEGALYQQGLWTYSPPTTPMDDHYPPPHPPKF